MVQLSALAKARRQVRLGRVVLVCIVLVGVGSVPRPRVGSRQSALQRWGVSRHERSATRVSCGGLGPFTLGSPRYMT
jgi:hypothetical protein